MAKYKKSISSPNRIYLHAEVAALVRLKDWNRAHTIIITRYDALGRPVLAKPCSYCQHILKLAGIKHVKHT